jgi:hypothetical protein
MDPLRNEKDPLRQAGPSQQQELFRRFTAAANGFSTEDVIGAAMNVLVNAIRQSNPSWSKASERYDEWMARFKTVLSNHYDTVTGKRRNIFPFHQTVHMDHFDARDKMN